MIVEVAGVPAPRVHVDPALGVQLDLPTLSGSEIEIDRDGPMLGTSLGDNAILSGRQFDLNSPRHDEVMLTAFVISQHTLWSYWYAARVYDVDACGAWRYQLQTCFGYGRYLRCRKREVEKSSRDDISG